MEDNSNMSAEGSVTCKEVHIAVRTLPAIWWIILVQIYQFSNIDNFQTNFKYNKHYSKNFLKKC